MMNIIVIHVGFAPLLAFVINVQFALIMIYARNVSHNHLTRTHSSKSRLLAKHLQSWLLCLMKKMKFYTTILHPASQTCFQIQFIKENKCCSQALINVNLSSVLLSKINQRKFKKKKNSQKKRKKWKISPKMRKKKILCLEMPNT